MPRRKSSDNSKKSGSLILLMFLAGLTGGPIRYNPASQGSNQTPQPTLIVSPNPVITESGDIPRGGREELATQIKDALNALEKSVELPYGLGSVKIDLSNPYSILFYITYAVVPAIKNILKSSKETAKIKEALNSLEQIEEKLKEFLETSTAKLLIDYYKFGKKRNTSDGILLANGHHSLQKLSIELSSELSLWIDQYKNDLEPEKRQNINEIIDNFDKASKLQLGEVSPEKLARDLDTFLDGLRRLTEKKSHTT